MRVTKESFFVFITMSEVQSSVEFPVLDLSQPIDPSLLLSLSQACQEWGFFYVRNHGISDKLFRKLCIFAMDIFSLPADIKLKVGPSSSLRSYTPHFIASPYFESLRVAGPDFFASAKSSAHELLVEPNSEYCELLQEYGTRLTEVSQRIMKILLLMLGHGYDHKFFVSDFSKCHGYLRLVNYSPPENDVEGLGVHTDMSCITIVYQHEIGGLQMRSKDGQWIDIRPSENSLVVNIGDLLQAWSNGKLISSEHRVVLKRFVNRLSLAFFWCFEDEKLVLAPAEIVGDDSRVYDPFVCSDYLKFRENDEEDKYDKIGCTVKDFASLKLKKEPANIEF